jgi:hypothetical protein
VLTGAAFVPHPPALVPAVGTGAPGELGLLRSASARAVTALFADAPDLLVLLGRDTCSRRFPRDVSGSLHSFGVDVRFSLGAGGPDVLPLSLTIGAHLIERTKTDVVAYGIAPDASEAVLDDLARLVDEWRVGLIVLGDGSARRSTSAPGYLDPRAAAFDGDVSAALAAGDAARLARVDVELGDELLAVGPPVWRAAASVIGSDFAAELLYDGAPFGVGYFVASWTQR